MKRRRALSLLAAAAALPAPVLAQAWPSKPIRVVVPFAPGGSGDITARLYGKYIEEKVGQPVVIENKPGANGIVGTEIVKNAPADGYTLHLSTVSTHCTNPSLYKSLPYDPERDFTVVGVFGSGGVFLVVRPEAPYKTLAAFVAHVKANPGTVHFAHFNTSSQIPGELLNRVADVKMVAVPYRAIGNAIQDFFSGVVQAMFIDTTAAHSHVASGKMIPIAITKGERWARHPDVPAMAELYPGFDVSGFLGMSVRAGTPVEIARRLNDLINEASFSAAIAPRLEEFGFPPQRRDLEQSAAYVRETREKQARYIKLAGIEPQ
ncbi:MAG: tripartite tricarboxylate transporter substrate binding protein [Rhodospirillales bacterium]|nr:MAG: tripartite tricarboxylate transporter substrate binding protein [Rhodospirillales bacterium]